MIDDVYPVAGCFFLHREEREERQVSKLFSLALPARASVAILASFAFKEFLLPLHKDVHFEYDRCSWRKI